MSTLVAFTASTAESKALAAAVSELARANDVIVLAGDLGAGKTTFTQGFGAALGVAETITSPTFTLVNDYRGGRLALHHLDVYRLEQLDEVRDLGLGELLDDGGVTLIEWGDTIVAELPADHLEVRLALGEGEDDRVVEVSPVGPRWLARERALAAALAPWLGVAAELPSLRDLPGTGD